MGLAKIKWQEITNGLDALLLAADGELIVHKNAIAYGHTPVAEYVIRAEAGKFIVNYGGRTENSYDTLDEAKNWAENQHYRDKMQPWLEQTPNLQDAIQVLVDACHGASVKGGWWHDLHTGEPLERNKLGMIALIHSEISEAVEGVRKGINDDHLPQYPMETVEMADTLVRIFDYIGGHGLDVANALPAKLDYNANRADHKPENRLKDGGKKY